MAPFAPRAFAALIGIPEEAACGSGVIHATHDSGAPVRPSSQFAPRSARPAGSIAALTKSANERTAPHFAPSPVAI